MEQASYPPLYLMKREEQKELDMLSGKPSHDTIVHNSQDYFVISTINTIPCQGRSRASYAPLQN